MLVAMSANDHSDANNFFMLIFKLLLLLFFIPMGISKPFSTVQSLSHVRLFRTP